tara:strand:- start:35 stop:454 length:420 start_codon:yes stop_codon:yes gene_type:complete
MDYLYKKADGSATSLGKTVTRLQLPEQTGGDMVFPGDQRPVDLGDYVLVKAIEVTESLSDSTKRGPTTVAIDIDAITVTVTETAVDKDADDLANDVSAARVSGYGLIRDQLDEIYWDNVNSTTIWKDKIAAVKKANPKA